MTNEAFYTQEELRLLECDKRDLAHSEPARIVMDFHNYEYVLNFEDC